MATESAQFKKAVEDSRKLKAKPDNDELLELYALFKQGTGSKFSEAEKPGMFDLKGKAKFAAWKKVAEEDTLSASQAQEKYVALVEKLKGKYGYGEA